VCSSSRSARHSRQRETLFASLPSSDVLVDIQQHNTTRKLSTSLDGFLQGNVLPEVFRGRETLDVRRSDDGKGE
jgi:hypothetical protein